MTRKRQFNAASYRDCHFVLDLAMEKDGLVYQCETPGAAISFKQRCNTYRARLREADAASNVIIPGYIAESRFDPLVIRQVDSNGKNDPKGCCIRFDHERKIGKIIDPDTGEEIPVPKFEI